MALDVRDPRDAAHIVALGEGATPVLDYGEHPVARAARRPGRVTCM
jgi:threonine synthase